MNEVHVIITMSLSMNEVNVRLREVFCLNTAVVIKLNLLAVELEATEIRKVMEVS
jgi:hypothetical protein